MKNLLFVTFLQLLFLSGIDAQSSKTQKILESVGEYNIDDNGYVVIDRIIIADSVSKDELFRRALEYFAYNYGDGKSVIQISDKEAGKIVGKGLYVRTARTNGIVINDVDTWHILKIEVKDGKARITISITEHSLLVTDMNGLISGPYKSLVTERYPFVEKGEDKNAYGQAFAEAYKRSVLSMDELEKSLKKSSDSNW